MFTVLAPVISLNILFGFPIIMQMGKSMYIWWVDQHKVEFFKES
jgi:hypothetical protein